MLIYRLARTALETFASVLQLAHACFCTLLFGQSSAGDAFCTLRNRARIASIAAGRRALPDALQSHSSLPEAAAGCLVQRTRRVCKLLRQRDAPTAEAAKHK